MPDAQVGINSGHQQNDTQQYGCEYKSGAKTADKSFHLPVSPAIMVIQSCTGNDMVWKPHVTVAAIIENDGRFLMVEELADSRLVINQPAGHLEPGESLVDAVIRETLEETGRDFSPTAVTGIYRWHSPVNDTTYLRVCFHGECTGYDASRPLDAGIQRALWLSVDDLKNRSADLRSPLVLSCIEDFRAGQRFPLDLLREIS
jgi:8-oxo-dGTP pyrophosphatase MutT (NUDIX family)